MSNLAVTSIKLTGISGAITNATGDITYLSYDSSGNIGVNGIAAIYHHESVTCPVSFKTINVIVNRPKKPTPCV
jgi:hypothetical protein